MTFTKTQIKGIKSESDSKLTKKVINIILDQGTTEDMEMYMSDVIQHGCVSGTVSELIYYTDTVEFYNKYKRDINDLLAEAMDNYGTDSPSDIFGEKWDSEDPLAEDTHNQNLLAWFAFEETTYRVANELELDI